nr:TetR/AcrR family transcriptional regulator [uncultured Cohaesibacter sp.]
MKAAEKVQLKKKEILAAAERLFLASGYGGTTMDAVADEAGFTKQTIYRYFPSKVSLFAALIGRFDETNAEFHFGEGSLTDELRRYGIAFISRHMQPRNLSFFRLMISESRENSELGDIFRSNAQPNWSGKLIRFLKDRVAEEMAEPYAQLFNAMLLSKRTFMLMSGGEGMVKDDILAHVDLVLDLFMNGIKQD